MIVEYSLLFLFLLSITTTTTTTTIPSKSYYLIDIDTNVSLDNYCLNISAKRDLYSIPRPCHHHLLCDSYNCDERSFRCVKLRETLCCLHTYIQRHCRDVNLKDHFRSIYFHTSIQHGYCEINLERIEQRDHSYCLTNHLDSSTIPSSPVSLKRLHRYHHHVSTPHVRFVYGAETISSETSLLRMNLFVLLLLLLSISS
jgi:hypothetical protein